MTARIRDIKKRLDVELLPIAKATVHIYSQSETRRLIPEDQRLVDLLEKLRGMIIDKYRQEAADEGRDRHQSFDAAGKAAGAGETDEGPEDHCCGEG